MNHHRRRKAPTLSRAERYARAVQKVVYAQKPTPDEARELRRNQMPDGSYPLVPLVRPAPAAQP